VLKIPDVSIIRYVCQELGLDEDRVLFQFNGVPCESFSCTGHTNKGRPHGLHGSNYRKADPERSPCCEDPRCKYGPIARAHDKLVQKVKRSIEFDTKRGLQVQFGIENPWGDLKRRPYMQPSAWKIPMKHVRSDCCAFEYELQCQKPMSLFTGMMDFQFKGTTGNGLCNNGQCGMMAKDGHIGKLGRDPKRGPRGPGATRLKNSLPSTWLAEILKHAVSLHPEKDIVIDVCAGWQCLRPVCQELGLTYIAIDWLGNIETKLLRGGMSMVHLRN